MRRLKPFVTWMTAAFACAVLAACGSDDDSQSGYAISNVVVINVADATATPNQTIVTRDGRITFVGEEPPADLLADTRKIDAGGAYAMPGLWDMHVHFRGGPVLIDDNALWMRQYTGYGITTVRDAGGDIPEAVNLWREEIAANKRIGPQIFTSLQKIDGPRARWERSLSVTTERDVDRALDKLVTDGADFIKIYDSTISADMYLYTLSASQERGLPTAGHLRLGVPFEAAVKAGLNSLEHDVYLGKAATPEDAALSDAYASASKAGERPGFWDTLARAAATSDPETLAANIQLMQEYGTAVTPTLYISSIFDKPFRAADYQNDPQLTLVPKAIRDTYQRRIPGLEGRSREALDRVMAMNKVNFDALVEIHRAGVPLLAGSDAGAYNAFVYPGHSLHGELAEMVKLGMTPAEALATSVINGPNWFGLGDDYGSLAVGKRADILLLRANPLKAIANTRSITGLIQNGRYFDNAALDAIRRGKEPG